MMIIQHKFVDFIPEEVEDWVLYISMKYRTAVHNCICGCGNSVVTPISPTDWKIIFNGKTISLNPSIGNWNFECRSHYWIKSNKIVIANDWSYEMIQDGRKTDKEQKKDYHLKNLNSSAKKLSNTEVNYNPKKKSIWEKLLFWK